MTRPDQPAPRRSPPLATLAAPAPSAAPADPPAPPAPRAPHAPHAGRPRRHDPEGLKPWQTWTSLVVASFILLAAGFGVGSFVEDVAQRTGPSGAEHSAAASEPYTLYITDAIGNLNALDVKVGGVFVGPDQKPMRLLNPAFDLASLHGPNGAIPLATSELPPDQRAPIIVIFESAEATIDGVRTAIPDLAPLVLAGSSGVASDGGGLLMDVDLMASLTERNGTMAFQPTLQAVYTADVSEVTDPAAWGLPLPPPPTASVVGLGAGLAGEAANEAARRIAESGLVPSDPLPGNVAEDAARLGGDHEATPGWMVQFHDVGITRERMISVLNATGAVFVHALVSLPAAYVVATEEQAAILANNSQVESIEREETVTYHDAESHLAIRLAQATDPLTGLKDAQGRPIRGTGIGVAVVDSGVDATHADLSYRPLVPGGVVGANYKVVSQAAVPLPNTDSSSGHGTHVASIVAGQGINDPAQAGVAPGATIYGLGIGESSTTVWAAQAFDWIVANGASMDPPIKVVTNSWGSGTAYNPDSVLSRLTERMVDRGMVVVYAAGNGGGNGDTAQTTSQCQIPRAGVVCVAAFDDLGTGVRDGKVASFSSRGDRDEPSTWPDLSAPGVAVRGARPLVGAQTGIAVSPYAEMSGTSQAAPHVAGIVALMLQADPSLTPAQVDAILKLTAYEYADGGAYSSRLGAGYDSHHAKGHGLADAYAAVRAALD